MRSLATPVLAVVVSAALGGALAAGCDEPVLTNGFVNIAEHDPYFPINPATVPLLPHAMGRAAPNGKAIDCAGCHDGRDSFNEPLCFACHSFDARPLTSVHSGIAGFQIVDSACLACHPDGTIGAIGGVADHSSLWFPIDPDDVHGDPGYVARVPPELQGENRTCNACHQEDRTLQNKCVLCHTTDRAPLAESHATLIDAFQLAQPGDGTLSDASCKECHSEIPLNALGGKTLAHDNNIIDTRHHEATCRDCHQVNLPEPKEWAIDFKTGDCICCHASPACSLENQGVCPDPGDIRCN